MVPSSHPFAQARLARILVTRVWLPRAGPLFICGTAGGSGLRSGRGRVGEAADPWEGQHTGRGKHRATDPLEWEPRRPELQGGRGERKGGAAARSLQLLRRQRAGGARGKCSRPGRAALCERAQPKPPGELGLPRGPPVTPVSYCFSVPADADCPGAPALPRILGSCGAGGQKEARRGPIREAPLGLSYLPLKVELLIRTTLWSGVLTWARCSPHHTLSGSR